MKENYLHLINAYLPLLWIVFAAVSSVFLSFVLMPCIIKIAHQKKLMAVPSNRSSHKNAVPTLGGVSIFISVILITILYSVINESIQLMTLILSLIMLFFLGVNDDLMTISAKTKFFGQLLVASLVIIVSNHRIEHLNGLLGIHELNYPVSFLFTLFVYILIINAYNLIDGIDALAGSIGVMVSAFFTIFFYVNNLLSLSVVSISLLGALLVFIRFNISIKNKIFMGDTGSMIVGFLLAFLSVKFLNENYDVNTIYRFKNPEIIIGALLFYPLVDTLRIFFNRKFIYKTSPFLADKNHIHHKFILMNTNHLQTTRFICFTNIIVLSVAIFTTDLEIHLSLFLTCLTGVLLLIFPFLKNRVLKVDFKRVY